jgi:hypothetical protein
MSIGSNVLPLTLLPVLELSAAPDFQFLAPSCVCAARLGGFGEPFIHFFLVGEQLIDARALLHGVEIKVSLLL